MWLAIEGIIGAGKTTTARLIGERTSLIPVIEPSDQHPLLNAYYSDPRRFALETELLFMVLQSHRLSTAATSSSLVSDFAPRKNFVFARLNCSDDDLGLLETVDERLWRPLPSPDLTVILDTPPTICKDRILERDRVYERDLKVGDLERLRTGYDEATGELGKEVRRLDLTGEETRDEVAASVMRVCGLTADPS